MTTEQQINKLKPGQSVETSRVGHVWCTVERSGDGNTLRFVRHTCYKSTVFNVQKF